MIGGTLLTVFLATMTMAMPLAFALAVAALAALLVMGSIPMTLIPQRIILGTDSLPLTAVPFFVLVGHLMNTGGITRRLIAFANTLVGRFPGGLSHTNVLTSMLFAGVSGSAVADTSALGSTLIPAMKREGYGAAYSGAVTAASSVVGPIIPPSIPMVIYGITAGVSIGGLFLGGAVPGILLGLSFLMLSYFLSVRRRYPRYRAVGIREIGRTFVDAFWALLAPVIILGGIFGGVFTVTESAAVAVVYCLLVGILVYREIKPADVLTLFVRTAYDSSIIIFLIGTASLFSWLLAVSGVARMGVAWLTSLTDSTWIMLLLINVVLLVVGMFLETISAMLIFIPLLTPVAAAYGIDPLHFGVVMVFNLLLGLLTPPMGICIHVAMRFAEVPIHRIVRETLPFLAVGIGVLLLITFVPQVVTYLPDLVLRR